MIGKLSSKAVGPRPAARPATRSSIVMKGSQRPLWLPDTQPPAHLNGTLPGDSGGSSHKCSEREAVAGAGTPSRHIPAQHSALPAQ
jgi:hypothetical protein